MVKMKYLEVLIDMFSWFKTLIEAFGRGFSTIFTYKKVTPADMEKRDIKRLDLKKLEKTGDIPKRERYHRRMMGGRH